MEAEGSNKRRRITLACSECSRRRRKCDGGQPACTSCVSQGREDKCSYEKPVRKRGPQAGYTQLAKSSSERVKMLETLLGDIFLLYPPIAELCEVSLGRKDFCSLLPALPGVPPRSEDDKKQAWQSSQAHKIIDEMMAAKDEEDEEDQKPSPPAVASTSSATPSTSSRKIKSPSSISTTSHDLFSFSNLPSLSLPSSSQSIPTSMTSLLSLLGSTPLSTFDGLGDITNVTTSNDLLNPIDPSLLSISSPLHFGPSSSCSIFAASSSPPSQTSLVPIRQPLKPLNDNSLPHEHVITVLFDTYLNGAPHASLPILNRQTLLAWELEQRSPASSSSSSPKSTIRKELLFAMFTVALPYSHLANVTGLEFKSKAEMEVAKSNSNPALETVQAHLLLAMVDLGLGELFGANGHLAMAISHASLLGIGDSSAPCYSSGLSDPYALRTFWALVVVDIYLALRIGRTPLLPPSSYSLDLPPADGPEESDVWRDAKTTAIHNLTPSSPLSTFTELVKLCVIGSRHLTRLNSPCDAGVLASEAVPLLSTTAQDLFKWEQNLPSEIAFQPRGQKIPPHKVELLLLYRSFMILCTRPRSPEFQLDSNCVNHLLAGLDSLSNHVETSALSYSRPPLESSIATFASTLAFPSPASSITDFASSHWKTVMEAATCLSVLFPSCSQLLETIRGMSGVQSLLHPSFSSTTNGATSTASWTNVESAFSGASSTGSHDMVLDVLPENGGNGNGMSEEWSKVLELEMQPAMDNELGVDLLAEFDFSSWTDSNEVLRCLGFRGATRPSSPAPGGNVQEQPQHNLDVDLFSRWEGQAEAEGEWSWD